MVMSSRITSACWLAVPLVNVVIIMFGNMLLRPEARKLATGCLGRGINHQSAVFCRSFCPAGLSHLMASWIWPWQWWMVQLALILGGFLIRNIVSSQELQFKEAQRARFEVERLAAVEREQAIRLEQTVSEYMAFVNQVSNGDLTVRLGIEDEAAGSTSDDLLVLGANLNMMVENLSSMAQQIREASASVMSASLEIQAAATQANDKCQPAECRRNPRRRPPNERGADDGEPDHRAGRKRSLTQPNNPVKFRIAARGR